MALDIIGAAVEARGDVDAEPGDARERDLVADFHLACLLRCGKRRRGHG